MDFFDHENPSPAAKRRDYRNVVIIQAALLTSALLLADILKLCRVPEFRTIHHSLYLLIGGGYFYLLWDLLKNFLRSRLFIGVIFGAILLLFSSVFILQNPFVVVVVNPVPGLITVHIGLLAIELLAIVSVFRDVFGRRNITKNNLWGAVSLFLMVTISFASVYDLLNTINPKSFGFPVEVGFPTYSEALYCSLVAIGGGAPAFPAPSLLVRNVAAIESIVGNLYLVILIGRMIGMVPTTSQQVD